MVSKEARVLSVQVTGLTLFWKKLGSSWFLYVVKWSLLTRCVCVSVSVHYPGALMQVHGHLDNQSTCVFVFVQELNLVP